jgi:hypothetical protein
MYLPDTAELADCDKAAQHHPESLTRQQRWLMGEFLIATNDPTDSNGFLMAFCRDWARDIAAAELTRTYRERRVQVPLTFRLHPLPDGTRVVHTAQGWGGDVPGGTGIVRGSAPCTGDTWEYQVEQPEDFSRRPGADNPFTRTAPWSSDHLVPAYPVPPCELELRVLDRTWVPYSPAQTAMIARYLTWTHPEVESGKLSRDQAEALRQTWQHDPAMHLLLCYKAARVRQRRHRPG